MSKVRINDLARELEVKSRAILETLPLVGVTEKKTHSSSLEEHEAEKVRVYIRSAAEGSSSAGRSNARPGRGEEEIKTKIDLSHISRPGDVLKAITQRKEAVAPVVSRPVAVPAPPAPVAPPVEKPSVAPPAAVSPPPPVRAACTDRCEAAGSSTGSCGNTATSRSTTSCRHAGAIRAVACRAAAASASVGTNVSAATFATGSSIDLCQRSGSASCADQAGCAAAASATHDCSPDRAASCV